MYVSKNVNIKDKFAFYYLPTNVFNIKRNLNKYNSYRL